MRMKNLYLLMPLNSQIRNSVQKCSKRYMSSKSKEDLIARIHKHNINTVTMVSLFIIL